MRIKKIEPLSAAKLMASVYAAVGLLIGGIVSLFALFGGLLAAMGGEAGGWLGVLFGVGAIVVMPLVYGTMGFIGGLIASVAYNLMASIVGPLEVQVE